MIRLIDTCALIYAIEPGVDTEEERIKRLRRKLRHCMTSAKSGDWILLPSIVLGEFLCGYELADHQEQTARLIAQGFFVESYTARDAAAAAALYTRLGGKKGAKAIASAGGFAFDFQRIKVDWQIMAMAEVRNACLITGDEKLCHQAKTAKVNHLGAWDLPDPPPPPATQGELFTGPGSKP